MTVYRTARDLHLMDALHRDEGVRQDDHAAADVNLIVVYPEPVVPEVDDGRYSAVRCEQDQDRCNRRDPVRKGAVVHEQDIGADRDDEDGHDDGPGQVHRMEARARQRTVPIRRDIGITVRHGGGMRSGRT